MSALAVRVDEPNLELNSTARLFAQFWRAIAIILAWAAAVALAASLVLRSPLLLSIATCCAGWAFVARALARLKKGTIQPITLFALSVGVTGMANAFAIDSISVNGLLSPYALYLREEYLFFASQLLFAGALATVAGYRLVQRSRMLRMAASTLPRVKARVGTKSLAIGGAVLAAFGLALHFIPIAQGIGTIGALLRLAPNLVAFTLARVGMSRRQRALVIEALVIALIEATRAALFAYLRSEVVLPLFAFAIGAVIGRRSLSVLKTGYFAPLYAGAIVFLAYFAVFGEMRGSIGTGTNRIAALAHEGPSDGDGDVGDVQPDPPALLVRLTSLNQMTQIGALVESDGFLRGQTLAYLGFAFVPRFLWAGKPAIAKGQWFAYHIGMAFVRRDGSYSNSINMTVPGELYLNYGWLGVGIGCAIFGAILAALWSTTSFWWDERNVLGTAFGFYLLWVGFGLGADLQILVTLIAAYCTFTAIGVVLRSMERQRARRPTPSQVSSSNVRAISG